MEIKKIDPSLHCKVFPLSLEPVSQIWFLCLFDKETTTLEDITHAFMTRYKGITQALIYQRELEILTQEEKEGFITYLTRWREVRSNSNGDRSSRKGVGEHFYFEFVA